MTRFNFTIQDTSPFLSYTGIWFPGNPAHDDQAFQYDGSFTVTQVSSAKATFTFVGTGASIFGAKRFNHGRYSVILDQSGTPTSSDGVGPAQFKVPLWTASGLVNKEHTVEVTNEPVGNRTSFDVDFISIEREIGQDGSDIFYSEIDDTAPEVRYHGSWFTDTTQQTQNHNLTLHSTTTPGSQVEITFHGCCIEIYGLYANAPYAVSLDKKPPTNMQGLNVDLLGNMSYAQTLLYLMDGLSEDTHTVSLTANANTSEHRPFSFDYAAVKTTTSCLNYSTAATSISKQGLSRDATIGLAVGVSLGGVVLLGLLVAAYLRFRRQRRPLPASHIDLLGEPKSQGIAYPVPWTLSIQPLVATPRSRRGTSTFSNSATSTIGKRTETSEGPVSTLCGSSSATQGTHGSWQGVMSLPKSATQSVEDNVVRGPTSA